MLELIAMLGRMLEPKNELSSSVMRQPSKGCWRTQHPHVIGSSYNA
jgi:hypothetical protein